VCSSDLGHLFGVVLRIQPDRAQAEDVLQEVYVNVWRAARSFDAERSAPLAWLTSIARHRAIDGLRRQRTDLPTAAALPGRADEDDEEDRLDRVPSPDADPLELLQQAADLRRLKRCLGELSGDQQQSLALAYYQGFSHAEVATHLDQPLGTVKSWVRRALASLKDCLDRAVQGGR
jgi:RNA polymerase sigma-70 factor (ECF subfamily)